MVHGTLRRLLTFIAAAFVVSAALASCSSDDGDGDASGDPTTTTAAEAPDDATTDADDESEPEEAAELDPNGLLEFLQAEDPTLGDLFDWNANAGVIAITYVGVATVQLFNYGELDADTAIAACELASDYVFPIDDGAAIEVLAGEYPNGTLLASVQGADGTCAAA
jgi:hypothetical protein